MSLFSSIAGKLLYFLDSNIVYVSCACAEKSTTFAALILQANLIRIRFILKSDFCGCLFTLFLASVQIECGSGDILTGGVVLPRRRKINDILAQCGLVCLEKL